MKRILFTLTFLLICQAYSTLLAQTKTAHVNTQLLLDTLPSRKKALLEVQEVTKRGETELLELDKQLQKSYNEYMSRKETQSAQLNQFDESKLQKLQQDLQKRENELNAIIQKMNYSLNDQSYKLVQKAVKTVADKKGFQYVLDVASAVYSGGMDITNDALAELLRLDTVASKP